jgi:uncharacterized membrane protein YidH (DUF202 family)
MVTKTVKNPPSGSNRRDHMANERTFLAWIRTSIGIMAFGFVLEKFALFIKQIGIFLSAQGLPKASNVSSDHQGYSPLFGIFFVGFGALIALLAYIKYRNTEKQIEEDNYRHSSVLSLGTTALVVGIGIFLMVYLLST